MGGATGYFTEPATPPTTLEDVFDVPDSLNMDDKTLLQALKFHGGKGTSGGARILLRAAASAVLSDAHPDVGSVCSGEHHR